MTVVMANGEGGLCWKVTASTRVVGGRGIGREARYRDARERILDTMQNQEGASRPPNCWPTGMTKDSRRT